ncbi:efflux RND transporter periplasmic adaptor subunit [Telmatocola sphagniphila]|uniref:efflux RND transporter periplasmic adaptor subunit n=1 Tax=Telmatocola sphagniphila TaxID=1123043 RepID=UPI001FE8699B|nr:efflux RND transporter periplasmic adaptor subunit [Telmatocola sphagniphila]
MEQLKHSSEGISPTLRLMRLLPFPAVFGLALGLGCQPKPTIIAEAPTPVIPVSHPVEREVTDYVDYTGRTDAKDSVSVRARATGYLTKVNFKEGADVKEGDLLFEIDPRPYQVLVDQAKAQVVLNEATKLLATQTLKRDKSALAAVAQQQIEQDQATLDQADAQIKVAKANLDTALLNLAFTKVTSPISGRISRYYYTAGNLITQDQTMLTTIVSMDPLYTYFDMDERTYQKVVKAINDGKIKLSTGDVETPAPIPDLPVNMALEGEEGFPHEGRINFINNQVNSATGTIAVRGIFSNPRPKGGIWTLAPGMFVRIRLPIGVPHKALLVVDKAIGSDQGLKYVYVVDAENKIQYRRVKTGPLQDDGLRVIEEGLKSDDWVAVGNMQQLRAKTLVEPAPSRMPTLSRGPDTSKTPLNGTEKKSKSGTEKKK